MNVPRTLAVAAGATLTLVAAHANADVVVRLRSGTMFRATRYWTQGETVHFEQRGGLIGLPRTAIDSIVEEESPPRAAVEATNDAASKDTAPSARTADATTAVAAKPSAPKADATAQNPAASTDADLAERSGEDLATRMLRLDKLLLAAHADLSRARYEQKSDEDIDRLQRRVDAINVQRQDARQRLVRVR